MILVPIIIAPVVGEKITILGRYYDYHYYYESYQYNYRHRQYS